MEKQDTVVHKAAFEDVFLTEETGLILVHNPGSSIKSLKGLAVSIFWELVFV